MALVLVERTTPEEPFLADLHDRYGLTRREVAVSHLLAKGETNAQIARMLGISGP